MLDAMTTVELHDSEKFPSIAKAPTASFTKFVSSSSSTVEEKPNFSDAMALSLISEIHLNLYFARSTWNDLDIDQLYRASEEAARLARSGLFAAELKPSVSVDEYGEFTFSHQSKAGYVDIGVRGAGELSYHVRNDIEPSETAYDDLPWKEHHPPEKLYEAVVALRKHLRSW